VLRNVPEHDLNPAYERKHEICPSESSLFHLT
jgi:hypothetical protein